MKTNVKKLGVVLLALGSVFVGCTKDEIKPLAEDPVESKYQLMDAKDGYSVKSLYVQKTTEPIAQNEADKLKGWKVYFLPDGKITAEDGKEKVNGKWQLIKGDYKEQVVVIDFGYEEKFKYLNNKWMVKEQTAAYYSFEDKDLSDGATSTVVLEK
jgi:hypothetical protein